MQERLAMQDKRQVKANHLFPLRAKAAADSSCTKMILALLSCTGICSYSLCMEFIEMVEITM